MDAEGEFSGIAPKTPAEREVPIRSEDANRENRVYNKLYQKLKLAKPI